MWHSAVLPVPVRVPVWVGDRFWGGWMKTVAAMDTPIGENSPWLWCGFGDEDHGFYFLLQVVSWLGFGFRGWRFFGRGSNPSTGRENHRAWQFLLGMLDARHEKTPAHRLSHSFRLCRMDAVSAAPFFNVARPGDWHGVNRRYRTRQGVGNEGQRSSNSRRRDCYENPAGRQ